MLHETGIIIQYCIFLFLAIQVAYLLFFSLAGKLSGSKPFSRAITLRHIRIFIPAYKEDAVIIATAKHALFQNYPRNLFEVVVIADSFAPSTLNTLRSLPLKLVEVNFEKSTKGKALQTAIAVTATDPADIVLVLDADNHMSEGFLYRVNDAFDQGYLAVQGHRTAKDVNTPFAFLDACTEEINNHIFRRGHVAVGLPSALIGSGMAFDYKLFVSLLSDIGETAGEDKELEFRLMRLRINVAFLDGAFVYDEKVAQTAVFSKQRSRWLAMQVEFFQKYFMEGWKQLFRGNIAFFNKVFQTFLLPRVMLVATMLLWMGWVLVFTPKLVLASLIMLVALALSLLLGIPRAWYNRKLLAALCQIPGAIFSMIIAMTNIGKARKTFIHTPHGVTEQKH